MIHLRGVLVNFMKLAIFFVNRSSWYTACHQTHTFLNHDSRVIIVHFTVECMLPSSGCISVTVRSHIERKLDVVGVVLIIRTCPTILCHVISDNLVPMSCVSVRLSVMTTLQKQSWKVATFSLLAESYTKL